MRGAARTSGRMPNHPTNSTNSANAYRAGTLRELGTPSGRTSDEAVTSSERPDGVLRQLPFCDRARWDPNPERQAEQIREFVVIFGNSAFRWT